MRSAIVSSIAVILLLGGCAPEKTETTTRGNIHIFIAESVAPAMVEEVNAFMDIYGATGANVTYDVVPSDEAIRRLLVDTARYVVSARPMTAAERQRVPTIEGFNLNEILIAYDGIVAVVHHKNPVEKITTAELSKILTGQITRWDQLSHPESMKGKIVLLIQDSSDVSSFAAARLLQGQPLRKDLQRTHSSLQTLRSVVEEPQSIGLVGVLWVDSARVPAKMLEVAEMQQPADTAFRMAPEALGKFYSPHPANVYRSYYPLKRAIYSYSFGPVGTIGSGFSTFVANKDGQRLFLHRNIVPGTQPIRLRSAQ